MNAIRSRRSIVIGRRPGSGGLLLTFISLVLVAGSTGVAHAAAGHLDPTFDGDGKVTTHLAGGAAANGVAVQPDGAIIVVGGANGKFGVARYVTSGALDPTFGGDGKVTTDFAAGDDSANASGSGP